MRMTAPLTSAILALLLMLPSTGEAQRRDEYYIELLYNTNLRAAPSLESERVDLVRARMVLVVVDEVGDWFKIDRFGNEMYMANWVPYKRVGGGTEVTTEYADLSCRNGPKYVQDETDSWEGHWEFGRPGRRDCTVTTRSPLARFPEEAFVDNEREIEVTGSQEIVDQINLTLEHMAEEAPEWRAFVMNAVDKIIGFEMDSEYDVFSADAYVQPALRTMYISRNAAFRQTDPYAHRLMSILAHEACHVYQVEQEMQLEGDEWEIMCHALEMDLIDAIEVPSLKRLVNTLLTGIMYFDYF